MAKNSIAHYGKREMKVDRQHILGMDKTCITLTWTQLRRKIQWLKLALWFWRRRFFNFVNVFSLFHNYLHLEKGVALHLNKLEYPSTKDALCQVWLKLAQWFWRRRFFNFVNVLSLIHI